MELKTITAGALRGIIAGFEERYPAPLTPTCGMGNHDRRRVLSRLGGNTGLAKLLALFQYTIRCVPITYNGDEIGMPDGDLPIKGAKDSQAHAYWWVPSRLALLLGLYINRDGCRTPMQWDDSPHGGFTRGAPWLPVHPGYKTVNAAAERRLPYSLLNIHRSLLRLRNERAALRRGSLSLMEPMTRDDSILMYMREHEKERLLVVMNVSGKGKSARLPAAARIPLFKTADAVALREGAIELPPWSGAVME
jgi:alpha-glucosidase